MRRVASGHVHPGGAATAPHRHRLGRQRPARHRQYREVNNHDDQRLHDKVLKVSFGAALRRLAVQAAGITGQ
jgi:hypothetical protein